MLPVRVLAVVAVASIAFVPQAALAGGCAPENAGDNAYRYGRVVLSYGVLARVIPADREIYQRVLRRILG